MGVYFTYAPFHSVPHGFAQSLIKGPDQIRGLVAGRDYELSKRMRGDDLVLELVNDLDVDANFDPDGLVGLVRSISSRSSCCYAKEKS